MLRSFPQNTAMTSAGKQVESEGAIRGRTEKDKAEKKHLSVIFVSDSLPLPYRCHDESIRSFIRALTKGKNPSAATSNVSL